MNTPGRAHGPGVLCVIVGLELVGTWMSRDNGRIVRIVKLRRVSPRHGNMWVIEPRDNGEGPLHVYRYVNGGIVPAQTYEASCAQKFLIPIGDDADMTNIEEEEFILV